MNGCWIRFIAWLIPEYSKTIAHKVGVDYQIMELLKFSNRRRLPVILQSEAAECSLACLCMVATYYGHRIDLTSLRHKFSVSLKGASLQHTIDVAKKLNFSTRALKIDLENIKKLSMPAILHWDLNHFVVLQSVKHNGIVVHDPNFGKQFIHWQDVSQSFTGIALELMPTREFVNKTEVKTLNISELWRRIIGIKSSLIQLLIFGVALEVFLLIGPYFIQLVVDSVVLTRDKDLLLVLGIGFILLAIFNTVVDAVRSWAVVYLRSTLGFQLVTNLFQHLLHLPITWFEKRHIGDITSRFSSLDEIKEMLSKGFIEGIIDGFMAIATLAMMYVYSPIMASIAFAMVIVYVIFRVVMYGPLRLKTEESIFMAAKEDSVFLETVRGMLPIKNYGKESMRLSLWQNSYADWINADVSKEKLKIAYVTFFKLTTGIEYVALVWVGALQIFNNQFSVGMLYAFLAYRIQFSNKSHTFVDKLFDYKMLGVHLSRVSDIIYAEQEEIYNSVPLSPQISQGKVELRNIYFRYSKNEPYILENYSLTIESGESVALVAPSGYGKTTLIKIMLGLLIPEKGQVVIDGKNIANIGMENYRKCIASVMQDDKLFSGSIAENIGFFDLNIDMEKVQMCARAAGIADEINAMPMDYQTLVGDMGSALSGGQVQRVLLARALYKQPKILFLDEATSHLDAVKEKQISNVISQLGVTRVMIAHRKETIAMADRAIDIRYSDVEETAAGEYQEQCAAV